MKIYSLLSLAATLALATEPVTIQKITVESDVGTSDITSTSLATSKSTTMTGDTAAILTDIPGVSVYNMGSRASLPVIHGLADDRVKIDIDGMTITSACPNHMNPALSYIDTSKIQAINVTAGITPVSEGGDSIGGTITVKSKDPLFAQKAGEIVLGGEVSGFYHSNGGARGASVNATAANDKISISYSGFAEKAGDYKDGNGKIVKSTLYQQQNHSATVAYKIDSDDIVSLKMTRTNADFIGFPNEYMDMLGNKSTSGNLAYKGKVGALFVDANLYRQNTDHYMNKILSERSGNMPMNTEAKESGINFKATLPLTSTQTLKFGGDYDRYRLNDWWPADTVNNMPGMSPNTFWNINNGKRDRIGLFAEANSQWNEKLSSVIGVRTDIVSMNTDDVVGYNSTNNDPVDAAYFNALDHKKRDNNFDFTAATKYEYSNTTDLELGFARKTRSPNMYERYAWAGSSGTYSNPIRMDMRMINWFGDANGYAGNLDLKPEVANTISATLSLHDASEKEWGIKLTPYYTKVNDFIDIHLVNTASNINYFQFVNTDAHLFGADLSGYTTLWDNADNGKGTLKGNLSYTRGFRDNGGSLYHMMPLHAKVSLDRVNGAWNNGIDIETVAAKESVDTLRKEPMTPGYALVNLRTGYAWSKQLNMDLSVTNFFNKAYALPLGGIDVVDYAASTYTPLQGMGRSFNAALTYKF
ncbi:MAG: TonB-dependent receptor [Sulfuricurvum sp.]|uniref:TonB-dependent receptor n=1 Tax=Sulfuricurvum sp. TaxID=2025608 RepID=UPI00260A12A8|nr:TonB-dependent receptor [Sulfuricurvum sp.]MDD2369797.1 TonB-dependent receptor [Sulfuricurvum sp.]MDD2950439.1 TonB-dependent receptor [Sulfuricurvum sp.]MDD5117526.1 TonB-dependent receptor [Sulfuricurvum sp.]